MTPTIRHLRAYTVRGGGADYHDQTGYHWIDDHIATPMAKYPEYRESRRSFGLNVLLLDEPVPVNGRLKVPDTPGFGVRLNPDCPLDRPYSRSN